MSYYFLLLATFPLFFPSSVFAKDPEIDPGIPLPYQLLLEDYEKALRKNQLRLPKRCPDTNEEWTEYRNTVARGLFFREAQDLAPAIKVWGQHLDGCLEKSPLKNAEPIRQCLARLKNYMANFRYSGVPGPEKESGTMGFNVPDHEYIEKTSRYTNVPAELEEPDFLQKLQVGEPRCCREILGRLKFETKKRELATR
jgi:hypothetical protein